MRIFLLILAFFLLVATVYGSTSMRMDMKLGGSAGISQFDPDDALLLEIGDYLLLENGDKLLLE